LGAHEGNAAVASDGFGTVDLSVARQKVGQEEVGDDVAIAAREGSARHEQHRSHSKHRRLDLPGDEATEELLDNSLGADQPSPPPPPPQHSLEDFQKQDLDPATLCVRMPCCRDYGPNCAHIPQCDTELCASRPCCT